jgi:hypothetical protein
MVTTQESSDKLTWLPGATAILAFLACNGTVAIVAILSLFGLSIVINPHIQAAVISLFALLTLGFVFLGYREHHVVGPLILSAVGVLFIIGTMFITFSKIVESFGLIALIVSAIWSWRVSKAKAPPIAAF